MPHKNTIIPHLDIVDELAKLAMSVNTVINESGKLIGKNTDHFGALMVLEALQPSSVLIYGAGSVVDSLILALKELGCPDITLHARRYEAAQRMAAHHDVEALDSDKISSRSFKLLINATPTSENKENCVFSIIDHAEALFDLAVSPQETNLCVSARKNGMRVTTGIEMSKWQLQKQFFHYTGVLPDIKLLDNLVDCAYKKT
jgi:shikimate 5-dehydrogenase